MARTFRAAARQLTTLIVKAEKRGRGVDLTPKHDVDLCATCSHSWIREDANGRKDVICNEPMQPVRITTPTVRCKNYRHVNEPDVYSLEKIAWIITTDGKGKIGFRPWQQMSEDEREKAGVRRT